MGYIYYDDFISNRYFTPFLSDLLSFCIVSILLIKKRHVGVPGIDFPGM